MGLRFSALVTLVLTLLLGACQPATTPSATPVPTSAPAATPTPTPSGVAVTASRVETLNSAAAAFASGDFKMAASLYERVVNTPPTSDESTSPSASATVTAFAHFRAMVAYLANGEEDLARAHRDALQQTNSSSAFADLATQLWDQYGMVGAVRGACAQLQPQIASQAAAELRTLQDLGVRVDVATLCSVPQG
jgi:hypothetical protein